jgi:hypothetical protein
VHVVTLEALVALEYVPTAQGVHVVESVVEEYVPARHDVQFNDDEAPNAVEYVPD